MQILLSKVLLNIKEANGGVVSTTSCHARVLEFAFRSQYSEIYIFSSPAKHSILWGASGIKR